MFIKRLAAVGLAVSLMAVSIAPAFAEEGNSETPVPTPVVESSKKTVDLACMQTAVEKRDNAIIAALDTYSGNVKTALTTRRDALKAAWGLTDKDARKEAVKAAWAAFKGTWKTNKKAMKDAKKAAWKQFEMDRKSCGGHGEASNEARGEVDL